MYVTVMLNGPARLSVGLAKVSPGQLECFAEWFRLAFRKACQNNLPLNDILVQYSKDPILDWGPGACHLYKIDVQTFMVDAEWLAVGENNENRFRDDLAREFGEQFQEMLLKFADKFPTVISQANFHGLTSTMILKVPTRKKP